MGIISREKFVALATRQDTSLSPQEHTSFLTQIQYAIGRSGDPGPKTYDLESAGKVFDQIKERVIQHGYLQGKSLRPWEIDKDITANLDRSQPWFGWEFETGYPTTKARAQVIEYVWNNFNGVAFDPEGEGPYVSEITFTPEEASKFDDDSAQASRFISYLNDNPKLIQKTGHVHIGTHINVSLPELTNNNFGWLSQMMNYSIGNLPQITHGANIRQMLFGRSSLYGGFGPRDNPATKQVWMEGKLFRTGYTTAEFKNYIATAKGLTAAFQYAAALPIKSADRRTIFISNLFDAIKGVSSPRIVEVPDSIPSRNGAIRTRVTHGVNGPMYYTTSPPNSYQSIVVPNNEVEKHLIELTH